MQEVLEHVPDYQALLDDVARVLKPGARLYCQVPFQIGFHLGPVDCWRFSRQGLSYLFTQPAWSKHVIGLSLGHGSGFYRIAVEFLAVNASCVSRRLYLPTKAAASLGLYPLKWFDLLTPLSTEADRIPGGYFCVATRSTVAL
jgi:hypothetical protein